MESKLKSAVIDNNQDEVARLLERSHTVDTDTAAAAVEKGMLNVVKTFLDNGGHVDSWGEKDTLLGLAIENRDELVVKLLLSRGATVDPVDAGNAALLGFLDVVEKYLQQGGDVNYRDSSDGRSALYMASEEGHVRFPRRSREVSTTRR